MSMSLSALLLVLVVLVLRGNSTTAAEDGLDNDAQNTFPNTSTNAQNNTPMTEGTFGPAPPWAEKGMSPTQDVVDRVIEQNQQIMSQINASGRRLDVVMYGDSITHFHQASPQTFQTHMGRWNARAFGVPASTVEQLMWRIASGNERPRLSPRVFVSAIGVVNCMKGSFPAQRYEEFVRWVRRAYPSTKIVLLAILPTTKAPGVAAANRMVRQVASQTGSTFVECGQTMDPRDPRLFSDELHLTAAGHDVVLSCLSKVVARLLGQ